MSEEEAAGIVKQEFEEEEATGLDGDGQTQQLPAVAAIPDGYAEIRELQLVKEEEVPVSDDDGEEPGAAADRPDGPDGDAEGANSDADADADAGAQPEADEEDGRDLAPMEDDDRIGRILRMMYEDVEDEEPSAERRKLKRNKKHSLSNWNELTVELQELQGDFDPEAEAAVGEESDADAEENDGAPRRKRPRTNLGLGVPDDLDDDRLESYRAAQNFFGGDLEEELIMEEDEKDADIVLTEAARLRKTLLPEVLQKQFLTEDDDIIRAADVPERLQVMRRRENRTDVKDPVTATTSDFHTEAAWMLEKVQHFVNVMDQHQRANMGAEPSSYLRAICEVLRMVHMENLDIPFIGHYRRDHTAPLQRGCQTDERSGEVKIVQTDDLDDLWEVYNASVQYHRLNIRRAKLLEAFDRTAPHPPDVMAMYIVLLQDAMSMDELGELEDYLAFYQKYFSEAQVIRKLPANSNKPLHLCIKHGLHQVIPKFGLTASEFQENLVRGRTHDVIDHPETPRELALSLINEDFSEVEEVLMALRFLVAHEIAQEPYVRKLVRQKYDQCGELVVQLTKRGETSAYKPPLKNIEINSCHKSAEILQLLQMQENGLVTLEVQLDDHHIRNALMFDEMYLSTREDDLAREWNAEREQMLEIVVQLLKQSNRDGIPWRLLDSLRVEAEEVVVKECVNVFKELAVSPAYQPKERAELAERNAERAKQGEPPLEDNSPEAMIKAGDFRVLACVYQSSSRPTVFVQLDENGEYVEQLLLNPVAEGTPEGAREKSRQEDRLRQFLDTHRPHVIALAATLPAQRYYTFLQEFFQDCLMVMHKTTREDTRAPVVWVPENIAKVYALSRRAAAEFPDFNEPIRTAISIGRRLRDPLCELCGLFNPEKDILSLQLSPLQRYAPDYLLERLEQVMAQTVSAVGVNINRLARHQHMHPMLQFVGGLGPRKAQQLLQSILDPRKSEVVKSRRALTEEYGLPPKVYQNCAGFIKVVDNDGVADVDNPDFDKRDATRIHPDNYGLAFRVAADALEVPPNGDVRRFIDAVIANPAPLNDLDMETGAAELECKGLGKFLSILNQIKDELTSPFRDKRDLWRPMDARMLFECASGLSLAQLSSGQQVVHASVSYVTDRNMIVARMDNGVQLRIQPMEVADDDYNGNAALQYSPGDHITAAVVSVDPEKFLIFGTLKRSKFAHLIEPVRSVKPAPTHRKRDKYHRGKQVRHDCWKDITRVEAEQLLRDGQCSLPIIRPSSTAADYVTITYRLYVNRAGTTVFNHLNVREVMTDGRPTAYWVSNSPENACEDLDEVIAKWVDPVVGYVQELLKHDYFLDGTSQEIENELERLKRENPHRTFYRFGEDTARTGRFTIYVCDRSVKQLPLLVTNKGYVMPKLPEARFRGPYPSVARLCDGFKRFYAAWKQTKHTQGATARAPHSAHAHGLHHMPLA